MVKIAKFYFRIISLIGIVAIPMMFTSSSCAKDENSLQIVVFSDGVRYKSMHDYKLSRLKNTYRETLLAAHRDDLNDVFEHIVTGLCSGRSVELDQFEIDEIVYELKAQKVALERSSNESSETTQLQEMVDHYVENKGGQDYYKIDPRKMKTIIISSK